MQKKIYIHVFNVTIIVYHHYAATLETDYLQLAMQLLEHWELMVEYFITLITFPVVLS